MQFHILFFFVFVTFFVGGLTGGFEVELIHRDSPHSPIYNQSSRAGLNQSEKSVQSIITGARGNYLMAFLIGTPPIKTYAIMDTGSDLIWIQCPPCIICFNQKLPLFYPTNSSTYHKVKCSSPICHTNCTIPSKECSYSYEYGDGSITSGILATESFGFQTFKRGVRVNAVNAEVVFGCGNNNMGTFSGGGSGIIGLGRGSLSLISQLGTKLEKRFSYCLPKSAEISSTFKFGVKASFSGKALSTPLIYDEARFTYYYVKLEGITIGGKKIATKEVGPGKGNTIMDSGTTLNLFEPELYSKIIATTKELIGLPTVRDLTHPYDLCYPAQSLKNTSVPTFTYHLTGADIELKDLNILISFQEITCIAIAPSPKEFNVYGNIAQKNFEVEYNLESKIISFEPAECCWKGAAGGRIQPYPFISSTLSIFLVLLYLI